MSDQSRLAFTIFLIFAVVLGSYLLVSPIKSASNNIEKSKHKIMVDGWSNEKLKALKGRFYIDDDSDTINRDGRTNLVESSEEKNPDGHCNLVEPSKIDNAIFGSELPKNKRVLKHGTMATQEFNIERITIQLDENGKIVKASIG